MHGNYNKESEIHAVVEIRPARGNTRGHQKRKTNEPDLHPPYVALFIGKRVNTGDTDRNLHARSKI